MNGRGGQLQQFVQAGRLLDADDSVVGEVATFLRDLLAAGKSASTLRSYGMDLLRWWRFLTAVDVRWNRATRVEARDFSCWIQLTSKPRRPQPPVGCRGDGSGAGGAESGHRQTLLCPNSNVSPSPAIPRRTRVVDRMDITTLLAVRMNCAAPRMQARVSTGGAVAASNGSSRFTALTRGSLP